ncbi:hypothetical protein DdX_21846 [Ditylenchus destructor]|uniref:F-box domain-containing protein n=1 Tax=Ditylenchus destructor TaxID=166010 RepID=A0AAD4QVB4_9BILA|nr:hypothetical protein DdX_21846 [Ditylenchus destructor]
MSCSKPLPHFTYDLLCYLNRDQLERFSIVCHSLNNFIDRYFHSKPYCVFDELIIRGGSYALRHKYVSWHPNRDDYSVQQFLAAKESNIEPKYYSFAAMRPYLGPAVRITWTTIFVAGDVTYNPDHIAEMESIAYLWRDRDIGIRPVSYNHRIVAEDFQLILNSPSILQCQILDMFNAQFSFKDYKVLYTVKVIEIDYYGEEEIDLSHWQQFLEEPGAKPVVALHGMSRESIISVLDRLKKAFSSAVSPNAFKIAFVDEDEAFIEFRETNKTTNEKLELKKGLPVEYQAEHLKKYDNYTLERSSV